MTVIERLWPGVTGMVRRLATGRQTLAGQICRGNDNPETYLRARALLTYAAIVVLMSLTWGIGHASQGNQLVACLYWGTIALVAVIIFRLARGGDLRIACHFVMATALVGVTLSNYMTGGLRLTNVCTYVTVIVGAIYLLGNEGVVWIAGAMVAALVMQIAHFLGYSFPDAVSPDERSLDAFFTWSASFLVVISFMLHFEKSRAGALGRLEAANQAKLRFLATISHEVRTPLHAILGMNACLRDSGLSERQREWVDTSQQNADGLAELFDDLLDAAALQSGRFTLAATDFDPVAVLDSVARVLRFGCDSMRHVLAISIADDVPRWVRGDPRRLRQVLLNIGLNAVKFTAEGSVALSVAGQGTDAAKGGGGDSPGCTPVGCVFTVSDTGPGIAEADRQRVFASFVQMRKPVTAARSGVGLGLSIAADLIRLMRGTIEVYDSASGGALFRISVPFDKPRSSPPNDVTAPCCLSSSHTPAESSDNAHGQRFSVLLIDDLELNLELGERMLRRLGYRPLIAGGGADGLAVYQKEWPDIVLLDLNMPSMDGVSVARAIRAHERSHSRARATIIAVTGEHIDAARPAAIEGDMDDILCKPFDMGALSAVLRRPKSAPGTDSGVG